MTYLALFHSALCLPALITALCPHFSLLLPLTIMVLPPLPTQSHLIDSDPVSLLSLFLVRLSHSIHGFMSSFLCDRTTLSTSPHPHQIPFLPSSSFQQLSILQSNMQAKPKASNISPHSFGHLQKDLKSSVKKLYQLSYAVKQPRLAFVSSLFIHMIVLLIQPNF